MLREVGLLAGLYAAYTATRIAATGSWGVARSHADGIVAVERWLGLDVELGLNRAISGTPWLEAITSYWYQSMHFLVTPAVLVLLYVRRPALYRPARTALMGATFLALVGYWFYPTAPPRLMLGGEYVDTVSEASRWGWWPSAAEQAVNGSQSVTNQVAAMPSMHVGWALWVSLVFASLARRLATRVAAFGYVTTTVVVVLVTGNHWVLDAVVGALVVVLACAVSGRAYRLWPAPRRSPADAVPPAQTPADEPAAALASQPEPRPLTSR